MRIGCDSDESTLDKLDVPLHGLSLSIYDLLSPNCITDELSRD